MHISSLLAISLAVSRGWCQSISLPPGEDPSIPEPPVPTETVIPTEPGSEPDISISTIIPDDTIVPTEAPTDPISVSISEGASMTSPDDSEPTSAPVSTTVAEETPTETTSTAPTSTSSSEPVPVDLSDAVLGDNAEFGEVDGKTAIVLSPPAYGLASLSVSAKAPDDLEPGEMIVVHASILLADTVPTNKRSNIARQGGVQTYTLKIAIDGVTTYDDTLTASAGGSLDIVSNPAPATEQPKVDVTVQAGEKPVDVSIYDMKISAENSTVDSPDPTESDGDGDGAKTTGGGGGKGGDDDSSNTASASATSSQDNGDDNMAGSIIPRSKLVSYAMGFIAALVVLVG